jgi:hypothetical protein
MGDYSDARIAYEASLAIAKELETFVVLRYQMDNSAL